MRTLILALAVLMAAAVGAKAESFAVVTNKTVISDCGTDCHMPFPPETLPKASWTKMLSNLKDHFGENISDLDPAAVAEILKYHTDNANDSLTTRAANRWRSNEVPERIQDAPRFKKKHTDNCTPEVWATVTANPKVSSGANCVACHADIVRTGSAEDTIRSLGFTRDQRRCFGD